MKSAYKTAEFHPEVSRLRRQVKELLDAARHNEHIHNRFQTIELALLAAQDFYAIAAYLQSEFRELVKLDAVSLVLIDAHNEISDALCTHGQHQCPEGITLLRDIRECRFVQDLANKPVLSQYKPGSIAGYSVRLMPAVEAWRYYPLYDASRPLAVSLYTVRKKGVISPVRPPNFYNGWVR